MIREKIKNFDDNVSLNKLAKIALIFLILYLMSVTYSVWDGWVSTIITIFSPVVIGFSIAFILEPLIKKVEKKGMNRNIAVLLTWIVMIALVLLFMFLLIPMVYDKLIAFISTISGAITWLFDKIQAMGGNDMDNLNILAGLESGLQDMLKELSNFLPSLVNNLPDLFSSLISIITNSIFAFILAIYFSLDYPNIRRRCKKFFTKYIKESVPYFKACENDLQVYVQSMVILIAIQVVEYGLFYYIAGHPDWLVLGVVTAFATLIPYIGGTIANMVGLLTSFSLAPWRIAFIAIGVIVLPNVDCYIVSPLVHKKRSQLGPIVTLIAVFAGGILYGLIGIAISMPIAIAVKSIYDEYHLRQEITTE